MRPSIASTPSVRNVPNAYETDRRDRLFIALLSVGLATDIDSAPCEGDVPLAPKGFAFAREFADDRAAARPERPSNGRGLQPLALVGHQHIPFPGGDLAILLHRLPSLDGEPQSSESRATVPFVALAI